MRGVLAITLLLPAMAQTKADPRIDQDTTTTRAQQVAALQKGPDRVVNRPSLPGTAGTGVAARPPAA
jgi:hypothetical protein